MTDWKSVEQSIITLYAIVDKLEKDFPGRLFTPDGHLVGSLGEVLAAAMFNLTLQPPSQRGFDAIGKDASGNEIPVEIKYTQRRSVSFNHDPTDTHVIVLALNRNSMVPYCVYNGPGSYISKYLGMVASNGQQRISIQSLIKAQHEAEASNSFKLPERSDISLNFSKPKPLPENDLPATRIL